MSKAGADPSRQSLQNRKRDQDAILVRGDLAVVLSLRFVSGNQLTKLAVNPDPCFIIDSNFQPLHIHPNP